MPPPERWEKIVAALDPTQNNNKAGANKGFVYGVSRSVLARFLGKVGERQWGVLEQTAW